MTSDPLDGAALRARAQHLAESHSAYEDERDFARGVLALLDRLAAAERAARTRPDYDFRCEDCGAPHHLDTSIPSAIWNAICTNRPGVVPGAAGIGMPEVGALCVLCIDNRLVKAGLRCEAEFYYVGAALTSKLYQEEQGDIERLERERDALRAAAQAATENERARCVEIVLSTRLPYERENMLLNEIADALRRD